MEEEEEAEQEEEEEAGFVNSPALSFSVRRPKSPSRKRLYPSSMRSTAGVSGEPGAADCAIVESGGCEEWSLV